MADGLQKLTPFRWLGRRREAAALLAADELTDQEIAAQSGVSRQGLAKWKRHPEFAAEVKRLAAELGEVALRYAVGRRSRRVKALDDRWRAMLKVIEDRAADPSRADVPGGATGLLVRNVKGIGAGENYREVREYEVDVALLRELRAHEEQAARELGQWVDKVAPTSPDGGESYAPFSDDERAAVLRAALARLGVAVDEPGAVRAALALGPPVAGAGPGDDGGGHDPGPLAGQAPPL